MTTGGAIYGSVTELRPIGEAPCILLRPVDILGMIILSHVSPGSCGRSVGVALDSRLATQLLEMDYCDRC